MNLTTDLLLHAYSVGVFPMAEHREDDEIFWVDPKRRGIFPLERFHISRSLAKRIRKAEYDISVNQAFAQVVSACADREETWINSEIHARYQDLHALGNAHSLEVWHEDALVGGVYGVSLGGASLARACFRGARMPQKLPWLF